jgi:calcineurin-like phosphoesterase family protein
MKFCPATRPYKDVQEMEEALIEAHNSVVTDNDEWHCLGDFAFTTNQGTLERIFKALKGKRKVLYRGNHDHKEVCRLPWDNVSFGNVFKIAGVKVHINHHPFVAGKWDAAHHGTYHLFGHVHGEPVYDVPVRAMDVGVDAIGPVPMAWEQIHERLSKIPVLVKHHD